MKNILNSFMAFTLIFTTLTYSRPSHALVGAVTLNPTVTVVGLVMAGGGLLYANADHGDWSDDLTAAFFGVIIGLAGLVVLEGENEVSFHSVTASQAKKIGLSQEELSSFNAEIDQVNAVASMVNSDLSVIPQATAVDSVKAWNSAKELIAPETFSAMVKISSQLVK